MMSSPRTPVPAPGGSTDDLASFSVLVRDFNAVRQTSIALCDPLEPEDFVVQSMPDASPVKWHLAHTTWFFEEFILSAFVPGYRVYHPQFSYLFNSYYNAVGQRLSRSQRGLITRPTVQEVFDYRMAVDQRMNEFLGGAEPDLIQRMVSLLTLGLNHEQQHQELLLTDVKHALWHNPLHPVFKHRNAEPVESALPMRWLAYPEGVRWVGFEGEGFAYDNEGPRHREFVDGFRIASRPVTNGEYLEFIEDGGYSRPDAWLSDGWSTVQSQGWDAPLYWERQGDQWWTFSLAGMQPVNLAEPVCHVSYYEADAFARWSGARLPTEAEWETAADVSITGNFLESSRYHPTPAVAGTDIEPLQIFGDVWEWTASAYLPYPGFQPASGAVGEYNGKFMCNQHVLRGGSCASPRGHLRPTYRNFFYADARWQFSGIRLAQSL
ncbi:ergothioneine biosynthesis protein EgtB [Tautonia rosea]|uniref:ergothioneine biosynthesis protein EgtB n=1 Tax=Tautonia rosea TaxID=2728037 RepID=UPI0015FEC79D|nr:ergothioneine biosynthesis protein EgtB [Tautonia rosea]